MGKQHDEAARQRSHEHRMKNKDIKHAERMALYRIMENDPDMKLWLIIFGAAALGSLGDFLQKTFPNWDISTQQVPDNTLQVSPWIWLSPALAAQVGVYGTAAGYDVQFGDDISGNIGSLIKMGVTAPAALATAVLLLQALSGKDNVVTKFIPGVQ